MDAMNVEKHSPSNLVSSCTKELIQVRNPTNATCVRKLSPRRSHISLFIRGLTQERNPTSAVNASKPSAGSRISLFTLERSLINTTNVGKLSLTSLASSFIRESVQERNPMDAVNVGKLSL